MSSLIERLFVPAAVHRWWLHEHAALRLLDRLHYHLHLQQPAGHLSERLPGHLPRLPNVQLLLPVLPGEPHPHDARALPARPGGERQEGPGGVQIRGDPLKGFPWTFAMIKGLLKDKQG